MDLIFPFRAERCSRGTGRAVQPFLASYRGERQGPYPLLLVGIDMHGG